VFGYYRVDRARPLMLGRWVPCRRLRELSVIGAIRANVLAVTLCGLVAPCWGCYLGSRGQTNASAAVGWTRALVEALENYKAAEGRYTNLPALSAAGYLDQNLQRRIQRLGAGVEAMSADSYVFHVWTDSASRFTVRADPTFRPGFFAHATEGRHFFVDESRWLRENEFEAGRATSQSRAVVQFAAIQSARP
jgi:hypothetical protein